MIQECESQVSNSVTTATSCYFSTCVKWIRRTAAENIFKIPLEFKFAKILAIIFQ